MAFVAERMVSVSSYQSMIEKLFPIVDWQTRDIAAAVQGTDRDLMDAANRLLGDDHGYSLAYLESALRETCGMFQCSGCGYWIGGGDGSVVSGLCAECHADDV